MAGVAEAAVNRALRLDPELDRILTPLAGKCLALKIDPGPERKWFITFRTDGIVLVEPGMQGVDVELAGSVPALLGLFPHSPFADVGETISIRGDSEVLMELKRALSRLRIDWREPLAQIFGDTAGYTMVRGLEQVADVFSRSARNLWLDTVEYLSEESDLLENPAAVSQFCAEVDRLRDDTARLEKRLQRLDARLAAREASS